MVEKGYFEERLIEKELRKSDENDYLNYEGIIEACEEIFGKSKALPYEEFLNMTKESYRIDMPNYAKLHNFADAVKIAEYFTYMRTAVEQNIPFERRTDKIIVIGCGQGRLADVYVTMARKKSMKEITFNDLIESHLEETRQAIINTYNTDGTTADGIKINYLPGDFLTVDISDMYDAAFMMWYVSSEFLDPSSSENMIKMRHQVYKKINSMLIDGGGLLEDIPDPNMSPGFYEIGNFKTHHVLKERGILEGQNHNLLLSNWTSEQTSGFPYQIRYTPQNGTDVREKEKAGFKLKKTESTSIPISSIYDKDVVITTIKESNDMSEAITLLHQLVPQTVKFPKVDQIDQKRRKTTWWEKVAKPTRKNIKKIDLI